MGLVSWVSLFNPPFFSILNLYLKAQLRNSTFWYILMVLKFRLFMKEGGRSQSVKWSFKILCCVPFGHLPPAPWLSQLGTLHQKVCYLFLSSFCNNTRLYISKSGRETFRLTRNATSKLLTSPMSCVPTIPISVSMYVSLFHSEMQCIFTVFTTSHYSYLYALFVSWKNMYMTIAKFKIYCIL